MDDGEIDGMLEMNEALYPATGEEEDAMNLTMRVDDALFDKVTLERSETPCPSGTVVAYKGHIPGGGVLVEFEGVEYVTDGRNTDELR